MLLIGGAWSRFFRPLPPRALLLIALGVTFYQSETLFTSRIDVPGDLAYSVDPWKASGTKAAHANSGIVLTQMIPWTQTARESIAKGELPLWNRGIGAGSPLLANLQTSILHPFTLLGLLLPIGDAWTLSVTLRLFVCLFFMFVFLQGWDLAAPAAIFGAIAYTFSSFHVISLLFPLGLTMMTLPLALTAVDEFLERPRRRSFVLLTVALMLAILGGHPESSLWVGLTTGAWALYSAMVRLPDHRLKVTRLGLAALAALCSALLTMSFWYPAVQILPKTERYASLTKANPVDHHIGADWMLPLITPNILGTPQLNDYRAPQPHDASLPDDYGEVAAGYAGLLTLVLAVAAALDTRHRRPFWFFAGAMLVAFLTIYETPLWYPLIRSVPWLGIGLHQRWRFLWVLGASVCASLALDAAIRDASSLRRLRVAWFGVALLFVSIYFFRWKELVAQHVARHQLIWFSLGALILIAFGALLRTWGRGGWTGRGLAVAAIVLTMIDLVAVMWRYNPPTSPERLLPVTGAIQRMQHDVRPYRVAALGWSFLPDTPSYYGLEDVKTTDVVQYQEYLRLYKGFLRVRRDDFNQPIGDLSQPFVDYLGVRYVYTPSSGAADLPSSFHHVYSGSDGNVYRNEEALPRYFMVQSAEIAPDLDRAIPKLKRFTTFVDRATVDHIPDKIARLSGGALKGESLSLQKGRVELASYGPNSASMHVSSSGWGLLVSSDVNMPGWRVYWNRQRLPPVLVNGAFLGTFVPPGDGIITFRYLPTGFVVGEYVAAGTLFLVSLSFILIGVIRRRGSVTFERRMKDAA